MQDWLKDKTIAYNYGEDDTIPQLLLKVKVLDVPKAFEIKQATEEYCKSIVILRLPVTHSVLNATELIWANVKGGGSEEEQKVRNERCQNVDGKSLGKRYSGRMGKCYQTHRES